MTRKRKREFFTCPHCGADVPVGARVCRACGSDEETGWSDEAQSGSDLGGYDVEDDFDYDAFVNREFPQQAARSARRSLQHLAWIVLIILVCLALLHVF